MADELCLNETEQPAQVISLDSAVPAQEELSIGRQQAEGIEAPAERGLPPGIDAGLSLGSH